MDTGDAVAVARERTIQALCHHYAHDRLTVEELDALLSRAQVATDTRELDALLAGLPAVTAMPARVDGGEVVAQLGPPGTPARRREERIATIMGEVRRTGSWTVPEHLRIVAVMSDVKLDLTEALLGPVTTIECSAWMAEVRVLVPPGVRLEAAGGAFLGSFTERWGTDGALPSDAPVVRVVGLAVMAEVAVKVAAPGDGRKKKKRLSR